MSNTQRSRVVFTIQKKTQLDINGGAVRVKYTSAVMILYTTQDAVGTKYRRSEMLNTQTQ